jgi:hypothetical protein
MLTQWEKELKLLEDWLRNPGTEEDFQRDAVVKNEENYSPRRSWMKLDLYQRKERRR